MPRLAVLPVLSRASAHSAAALARSAAASARAFRWAAANTSDPGVRRAALTNAHREERYIRRLADAIIAFNAAQLAYADRATKAAERTRLRGWATTGRPER